MPVACHAACSAHRATCRSVSPISRSAAATSSTVRAYVELIRKAKTDSRISRHPAASRRHQLAVLGQAAGAARRHRRLQDQRQVRLRLARVWRRSRSTTSRRSPISVYLLPSASLDLTGVASYEVFLRGTFDWIGTYPDFLHVGDYKTAVNTYLEKYVHAGAQGDERVAQPQPVRSAGAQRSPTRAARSAKPRCAR